VAQRAVPRVSALRSAERVGFSCPNSQARDLSHFPLEFLLQCDLDCS